MKKLSLLTISLFLAISMTACGEKDTASLSSKSEETSSISDTGEISAESAEISSTDESDDSDLVIYDDPELNYSDGDIDYLEENLGHEIKLPEDAEGDIYGRWFIDYEMAEVTFHSETTDFTLRVKNLSEFYEITDLKYQSYDSEEECTVCGKYEGIERRVSEAGTYYDSLQWYDSDEELIYSLTAMSSEPFDGFDIMAYAEQIDE